MMKLRNLWVVSLLASMVMGIWGCGGSSTSAYQGLYEGTYTQPGAGTSSGSLVLLIKSDNTGEATVHDSVAGTFTGSILATDKGAVSGSLSNGIATVSLVGTFTTGQPAVFTGTLSGAINASVSATYAGNGIQNAFAGQYSGHFSGDDAGTWLFTVDTSGDVVGTANDGTYTYNFTGQVGATGATTVTGNGNGGGGTFTWTGAYYPDLTGIACSGTWVSDTKASGTWQGHSGN